MPNDPSFISSLWTIAENVIDSSKLCSNTLLFISVMKMIKLSRPCLTSTDMLLEDPTVAKYPTLLDLRTFVLEYSNSPVRLQDLCRTVIREELKDSPLQYAKDLPMPQKLKDFVLFEIM